VLRNFSTGPNLSGVEIGRSGRADHGRPTWRRWSSYVNGSARCPVDTVAIETTPRTTMRIAITNNLGGRAKGKANNRRGVYKGYGETVDACASASYERAFSGETSARP
jgi:hypothetical protein